MAVVSDCSGKGYFFARTESPALAKVSAETHRFFASAEKKGGGVVSLEVENCICL